MTRGDGRLVMYRRTNQIKKHFKDNREKTRRNPMHCWIGIGYINVNKSFSIHMGKYRNKYSSVHC